MAEISIIALILLGSGANVASFGLAILASLACAAAFGATVVRRTSESESKLTTYVISGTLGLCVAVSALGFDLVATRASSGASWQESVSASFSAAALAAVLATAATYGALVALCSLLPSLAGELFSSTAARRSRGSVGLARYISLVSATLFMFLLWAPICEGLLAIIRAGAMK